MNRYQGAARHDTSFLAVEIAIEQGKIPATDRTRIHTRHRGPTSLGSEDRAGDRCRVSTSRHRRDDLGIDRLHDLAEGGVTSRQAVISMVFITPPS